jgi:hypothetical protein
MQTDRIVRRPTRVFGLGAPISLLIFLEGHEIPALRQPILGWMKPAAAAERARRAETHSPDAPRAWRDMLAELDRAANSADHAVLWPTVYAERAFRGAIADTVAAARSCCDATERASAFAVARSLRGTLSELQAVDDGGLPDVWL